MVTIRVGLAAAALLLLGSCGDDDASPAEESGDTGYEVPEGHALVTHSFGEFHLQPFEEVSNCVSWTLNNEKPVYVEVVTLANGGSFHHSNWFVVPDNQYDGPDGFWRCSDRGFEEIEAARLGTVIFAQSTQSWVEEQRMPEGVVIKIPAHHRVVAGTHLLNLASREVTSELRMSLEIIHPEQVETLLTPFRLSYLDLQIPPESQSHFSSQCPIAERYEANTDTPLDIKLYYALPHYHTLGNHFSMRFLGGPRDGETIYQLDGFNGEANGQVYDPPVDFTGADGVSFTCGYNNWRNETVGWGIGDQEMCVMLGLAESSARMDATVLAGQSEFVTEEDGIKKFEGDCLALAITKSSNQSPPTQEEIDGELYIPPTDENDEGLPPVPQCVDADEDADPGGPPLLSVLRTDVFLPTCSFQSCHSRFSEAGGLNFEAEDLHAELLGHGESGGMPLVDPGNPDNSWLYKKVSACEPKTADGNASTHMPLNAPFLLEDELVAQVRQWIDNGALND